SWRQVHREFQGTLANRYPFSTDAEDASLEDFVAFFGPDGTFWRYYKENLAAVVSEDGREVPDQRAPVSEAMLRCLSRAYRIRRAFFPSGKLGFSLSMQAEPPVRPQDATFFPQQTRLEVGGQTLLYEMGPGVWKKLEWPGPSPERGAAMRMVASGAASQPLERQGAWGFFRLLDAAQTRGPSGGSASIQWTLNTDKGTVALPYKVQGLSTASPLDRDIFRFSCPADIRESGR
ncbi:MAG: type VI secretion IcmF C-terminal domain-containing protein, partial [Candidatus Eisenbacteria bacterium]